MNSALPDFIRESAGKDFVVGIRDCCLWACDWVVRAGHADPAAPWRGTYFGTIAAQRIIRRAGGLVELVSGGMAAAGLVETADAMPGDVGVVATPEGEAMAIRTRIGWAVLTASGVQVDAYTSLKVWRV